MPAWSLPPSCRVALARLACVAGLAGLMTVTGCQQQRRTSDLDQSLDYYARGQYEQAARSASALAAESSGQLRYEAAYVSGLSAYRLGRLADAERHLNVAAGAPDHTIAANAKATLGLVRLRQDRPSEAASYFDEASARLTGPDAASASRYADHAAALAAQSGGQYAAAGPRPAAPVVAPPVASPAAWTPREPALRQIPETFALQAGAFRDLSRAERLAVEIGPVLARRGLGSARIVPKATAGGRLYAVQFGQFESRADAARARAGFGRQAIVTPYATAAW